MIWKPIYIILIALLCTSAMAAGVPDSISKKCLMVNDNNKIIGLENFTQLFVDEGGQMGIDQIIKHPERFRFENPYGKSYSKDKVYWLKFNICTNSCKDNELIFQTGLASDITCYFFSKNKLVSSLRAGYLYDHHDRKYQYAAPSGSAIPTILNYKDTTLILVRFQEHERKNLYIFPNFKSMSGYMNWLSDRNMFQGVFHGILIIMILYHLLLFYILRDRLYIHYSLYLFFVLITFLFPFGYLWRTGVGVHFWLQYHLVCWTEIGAVVFYLLFIRNFIHTSKTFPGWDKALKMIIGLSLSVGAVLAVYYQFTLDEDTYFFWSTFMALIAIIFSLVLLVPIYRNKNKLHHYYIWGTTMVCLCIAIGVVMLLTNTFYYNFQQYIIELGVVFQIVTYALGMGEKMKLNEEERRNAQENLIAQLKENEELQTKVNRELEEKVRERTSEIEQQKEEILTQAGYLEMANAEITAQKNIIEKEHNNMTDSIRYAQRIQNAVLPKSDQLNNFKSQHFILFKPRDIVSGDFYFFEQTENSYIIAAADCTGHGVPGAFMSMLGVTLLNEIIRRDINLKPNEILDQLRISIKLALRQTGTYNETQDGMDIALCVIQKTSLKMDFAGAYNPLILFRNNELLLYPADRMPVSVYVKEQPFTNTSLQLMSGDVFYLFSDGYYSQFNGETKEKFKNTRFKQLLQSIHQQPMNEQKKLLTKTFDDWQGSGNQTDDVLVIGIKIN